MVAFTGFNCVHEKLFGGNNVNMMDRIKKFYGYDLRWLVSRTSYKFTPQSKMTKISADESAMTTQIVELPNVLMMDY
jgi:hypothetical protein